MNNKVFIIAIGIIFIGTIGGCFYFMNSGKDNLPLDTVRTEDSYNETNKEREEQLPKAEIVDKKVAIIYFSATATTKMIVEYIQNTTNGNLIEIVPVDPYTSSDLNYNSNYSRTNKEQNDSSARSKIENQIDPDTYDVIYLGYPIWWGDAPPKNLDNNDLDGQTVIPFSTSHSSEISGSLSKIKNDNSNIKWLEGKRFSSSSTQKEINDWVESIESYL